MIRCNELLKICDVLLVQVIQFTIVDLSRHWTKWCTHRPSNMVNQQPL